ncbi:MAG TPA: phosphatidylglycerol lysyltransferase domain-containing protein [Pseudonocardiaceae bacterium]|jgi:lysyl-tRNA synthetase class 2|nr:phosphatidylglycerol lysyltransferase domain-containing protein [Pseudonocardiaceae bacterium]
MTTSASDGRQRLSWPSQGETVVRVIAWSTRLVGLITLLSVVFPPARRRLRDPVAGWLDLSVQATVTTVVVAVGAGIGLLLLSNGLRRHKRRAWQIALAASGTIAVLHFVAHRGLVAGCTAAVLVVVLVVHREKFVAQPDPSMGRWPALLVFLQLLVLGAGLNFLILLVNGRMLVNHPSTGERLAHALLTLVGVSGPVQFRVEMLNDLTAAIGLAASIGAFLLGGYFLLRSAEPRPSLEPEDETRIRGLLDTHGRTDSLGYFALRRDKSAVFSSSGKSAVAYRVLAGVALSSGDPLGDVEAWPGAVEEFLGRCLRHGWVPAVLGCSERAATVWSRYGLTVLELGDEAVVDAATFTLDGRSMRGVRQAVARVRRSGYEVRVRRASDLTDQGRAELAARADSWRGTETERGFSMALSRLADAADPACVLVTAEQDGVARGLLQFVPWGPDGLSLDLMRRDRDAPDNGLNEFMICELMAACPALGVRHVSLNFAMFRAALERGERIGAGPVARLWAKALRLGSRWWQIETLYRFNAKFQPTWVPRYLVFPMVRDLPRIILAAMEAEGFGGRPPALLRMLRRSQPVVASPQVAAS